MKQFDNIKDIQRILFDSLCYFDDFCRKHEITYYLANGTLLGAVKYGQFIPWDDDIDILLPRKDYDRLVQLRAINNGNYRLLCREQFTNWRIPYAKLSYEKTLLHEGDYDFGTNFGISLDIFPIDKWIPCHIIARLQALRNEIWKRMLICSNGKEFKTKKSGIKRFILKTIWKKGTRLGYKKILYKINHEIEKSQKRKLKYVGCIAWTCHADKEVFSATLFKSTEYLTFCGRKFPTFSGYEEYLDNLYDKWREELPPEKQHSNHEIKVWWKDAN